MLDLNKRQLITPDEEIEPPSDSEFQLLLELINHAGEAFTRAQFMSRIHDSERYPDGHHIDVLVGRVRRNFSQYASDITFISTIHGTDYLFAPPVD